MSIMNQRAKLALYLPLVIQIGKAHRVLQEIEGHGIGCVKIGLPVSNPFGWRKDA